MLHLGWWWWVSRRLIWETGYWCLTDITEGTKGVCDIDGGRFKEAGWKNWHSTLATNPRCSRLALKCFDDTPIQSLWNHNELSSHAMAGLFGCNSFGSDTTVALLFLFLDKNHYAPVSQANWCNMTFAVGNLFPSHSWIGWSESTSHWDSNPGPQLERRVTYQLSYPSLQVNLIAWPWLISVSGAWQTSIKLI